MSKVTDNSRVMHSYEQRDESVHSVDLDQAIQKRIMKSFFTFLCIESVTNADIFNMPTVVTN